MLWAIWVCCGPYGYAVGHTGMAHSIWVWFSTYLSQIKVDNTGDTAPVLPLGYWYCPGGTGTALKVPVQTQAIIVFQ